MSENNQQGTNNDQYEIELIIPDIPVNPKAPVKKPKQASSNTVIALLLVVVLLLLVVLGGIFAYISLNSDSSNDSAEDESVTTITEEYIEPETTYEEEPAPVEEIIINEPADNDESEIVFVEDTTVPDPPAPRYSQKDVFLDRASDIEWYSDNYLSTADNQAEMNSESGIVSKKWDDLLNDVYQYLKASMSPSEFNKLRKSEIEWIKQKEAAMDAAEAEWQGGSGAPMARNMVCIDYTRRRCYYLISLIN